jgi:hypothetical protein
MPPELVKELKIMAINQDKTLRELMITAAMEYAGRARGRKAEK